MKGISDVSEIYNMLLCDGKLKKTNAEITESTADKHVILRYVCLNSLSRSL